MLSARDVMDVGPCYEFGGVGGVLVIFFRCMSVFRANIPYLWILKYQNFVMENCWYVAVIVMVIFVIYNTIIVRIIFIVSNVSIFMITTIAISTITTITSTLTLSVSSSPSRLLSLFSYMF